MLRALQLLDSSIYHQVHFKTNKNSLFHSKTYFIHKVNISIGIHHTQVKFVNRTKIGLMVNSEPPTALNPERVFVWGRALD